jgi:hypothetical protein
MPDMETAFAFRRDMYAHMGVALPTSPPKKVLVVLRDQARRRVENKDELVAVMDRYNLSYTYVPLLLSLPLSRPLPSKRTAYIATEVPSVVVSNCFR